ncbi:MAG: transglutaminase-like domain-containing protein [Candidatus Micrarchaeota archaeon]
MKIFPKLIVLAVLLLLPALAADTIDIEPKMTGASTATISLVWHLDLQGQQISEMDVKTFGFKNYKYQALISESTNPVTTTESDKFNNKIRMFGLTTGNYQSFSMDSEVKAEFGFNFQDATDASQYLKESRYVNITPEIREKATQIAALHRTDTQKAVALAQWVHNNIEYDQAYIGAVESSDEVYSARKGTCDEFSHLYIAMLRAIGIPAKFSASYVYSGKDWGAHAFVEAAIGGKWVPFDPTFNEAIILDATHLKFGEGFDQGDIKEDITIRSIDADVSKIRLSREFEITFKEVENFPEYFSMELVLPDKVVGEGSIESIKAKLKNGANTIAVPLSLTVPKEVGIAGESQLNEDKLVLLEPFEEKEVEWKIIIPQLDEGYDYKFPVDVSSLGQKASGTIKAEKEGDVAKEEDLQVTGISSTESGDWVIIKAEVRNTGNVDSEGTISIKLDGQTEQAKDFAILANSQEIIEFRIERPKEKEVAGELLIDAKTFTLTQPFSLNFGVVPSPSEGPAASVTETPTEQPSQLISGIPDGILWVAIGILLAMLVFSFKPRR